MIDQRGQLLRAALGFGLGLVVAACASVQNTPAQDRTWNAYRVCTAETGANAVMQR